MSPQKLYCFIVYLLEDEQELSLFAWLRTAPGGNPIAVISNFTPVPRENYRVPLPHAGSWREIVNTDATTYDGSGKGNGCFIFTSEK